MIDQDIHSVTSTILCRYTMIMVYLSAQHTTTSCSCTAYLHEMTTPSPEPIQPNRPRHGRRRQQDQPYPDHLHIKQ